MAFRGIHRRRVVQGTATIGAVVFSLACIAGCSPSVSDSAPRDPFAEPVVPGVSVSAGGQSDGSHGAGGTLNAPRPRRGQGEVVVALLAGARFPEEVIRTFTSTTGFTVRVIEVESAADLHGIEADVILGLDPSDAQIASSDKTSATRPPEDTVTPAGTELTQAPGAVAYGRDDVCVLADVQWLSANNMPVPASMNDIAGQEYAGRLVVPDPTTSSVGRAFLQSAEAVTGASFQEWMRSLKSAATIKPTDEAAVRAWSASARIPSTFWTMRGVIPGFGYTQAHTEAAPDASQAATGAEISEEQVNPGAALVVAPRSVTSLAVNNSGTESSARAIDSTCIERPLYAAKGVSPRLDDGAESLIAWLLSVETQRGFAQAGALYPLEPTAQNNNAAQWFLTPSGQEVSAQNAQKEQVAALVEMWRTN